METAFHPLEKRTEYAKYVKILFIGGMEMETQCNECSRRNDEIEALKSTIKAELFIKRDLYQKYLELKEENILLKARIEAILGDGNIH